MFMSHRAIAALATLGALLASTAPTLAVADGARADLTRTSDGNTYFNKPGASVADHAREVRECASLGVFAGLGVTGQGMLVDIMRDAQAATATQTNIENCMVARGWRVMRVTPSEAKALGALEQPVLAERLASRFGAENPPDTVVRTFKNEAARGDTIWGGLPSYFGETQLSVRAVDLTGLKPQPKRILRKYSRKMPWIVPPLKPEQLRTVASDQALVIVHVIGSGQTNGEGFSFTRMSPKDAAPELGAYEVDGHPDTFYAGVKWTLVKGSASEKRELLGAFATPPGRWRLTDKMGALALCLGAPAFDIEAGEVIYIGAFDLVGDLGPNMDPAPARALLAATPELSAKLKTAQWIEDTTAACSGVNIYRLSFDGH